MVAVPVLVLAAEDASETLELLALTLVFVDDAVD